MEITRLESETLEERKKRKEDEEKKKEEARQRKEEKEAEKAQRATKAAQRDAEWSAEDDASIESMIKDGFSFTKIASKLGNGHSRNDIIHRWYNHLKESSGIIKPAVQPGFPSRITWTEDVDASIVRM